MGDLYEERQKIFAKGREPNEKDDEKFGRNIKKYQEECYLFTVRSADCPRTVFKEKFENFNKLVKKLQCKLQSPSSDCPRSGRCGDGKKYFSIRKLRMIILLRLMMLLN